MPASKRPLHNDLDTALLEPGDVVLVANSHDNRAIRWTMFWSHAAIYTGREPNEAFIDAVNLPVGRHAKRQIWRQVRFTPMARFRHYEDVLVLRPKAPPEVRRRAAEYAVAQVGKPFPPTWRAFFTGTNSDAYFSCTSLIWHAYHSQGIDLSARRRPFGLGRRIIPSPRSFQRHPRLRPVARGTRVLRAQLLAPRGWIRLAGRIWFCYGLRVGIVLSA